MKMINLKKKEPFTQMKESINKGIPLRDNKMTSKIFHLNLNKIFSNRNYSNFGYNKLYQISKDLSYSSMQKEIQEFEKTKSYKEFEKKEKSYKNLIFEFLGRNYRIGVFLDCVSELFLVPIPFLIKKIIKWLNLSKKGEEGNSSGFFYCGMLIFCMVGESMLGHISLNYIYKAGARAFSFSQVRAKSSCC